MIATSAYGNPIRRHLPVLAALAALAALPTPARAANTVGDMVYSLGTDLVHPFMLLLVALAYLMGFWLAGTGLLRLKDVSDRGGDNSFMDAMMRIMGGSLLIALPDAFGAGLYTLYQQANGYHGSMSGHTPVSPQTCVSFGGGGSTMPLACAAQNVAQNVVPIFVEVSFILCYVFGAVMIVHALYTMAMSHSTGQRQFPKGWAARLIIGFVICNVPMLMNSIENTLGVSGGAITNTGMAAAGSSMLAYTAPTGIGVLAQYGVLIQNLFVIFVMFGVIAVWRGIVHLKAFADGSQGGTLGSGMTHIVGGVLLANCKFTVCILVNTVLGLSAGSYLGFC